MPVEKAYRMRLLESREILETEPRHVRVPKVPVKPSTREVFEAFEKSPGYEEIVARLGYVYLRHQIELNRPYANPIGSYQRPRDL